MLNFSHTIECDLVHRRANSEVFVTSTDQVAEDNYRFGAQLPRWHPFFSDTDLGRQEYDPLLIIETARQGSLAVVHRYLGVPTGSQFVIRTLEFREVEQDLLAVRSVPADVVGRCRIMRRYARGDQLTGVVVENILCRDGRPAARVEISASWVDTDHWKVLRQRQRAERAQHGISKPAQAHRIAPAQVGRADPRNVVLSPARHTDEAVVVVDTGNPTLFDHHVDHVPGMLELEAARQHALLAFAKQDSMPEGRITAIDAQFRDIAELDLPLLSSICAEGRRTLASLTQAGRAVAEIELTWQFEAPGSANEFTTDLIDATIGHRR
ncbi:ScbA/BarX family gamma-butyrolactone biosynthesis protein [Nocardia sp. NPDC050175]|uniref:ScbA/BarX family gamma-butyrolactone biosynthesis protein n=1 Tax=Nocardia sp. NPDC050175 TaxID=3364317 RepID=UPI0037A61FD6